MEPLFIKAPSAEELRRRLEGRGTDSAESIEELCRMPWRGNVRELRNVVERLIILGGDNISIEDIHAYVSDFV